MCIHRKTIDENVNMAYVKRSYTNPVRHFGNLWVCCFLVYLCQNIYALFYYKFLLFLYVTDD